MSVFRYTNVLKPNAAAFDMLLTDSFGVVMWLAGVAVGGPGRRNVSNALCGPGVSIHIA
jgi:hypothetical protein